MRKIIIAISCCIVLLLVGYAGFRGYQVWKQNHLLALAKTFAGQGDFRNEMLSLQQVLRVNPRNLEAARMMAALTEAARSPEAIIWRERIVTLNPKSIEDRLALVQTALLLKDMSVVTNTLNDIDPAAKNIPAYYNLAGLAAVTLGQGPEAEKAFSEAVRLEPGNPVPQVNLAVVRLHSTNELDMAEARISLKRISMTATNLSLRSQATRELVIDAMRSKDLKTALALSLDLTRPTNALFADKMLRLDVLKEAKSPELKTAIIEYQREAAVGDGKLSDMATWLRMKTSTASALAWLQSLPMQTQTNQPAALVIAECQAQVKNWPALQAFLEKQDWDNLEYARHAFLARALRSQNMGGASSAEWELALKYAGSQKSTLILLFRLAAGWSWVDEAEQILWTIVNRYPEEKWAGQSLQQALIMGGRTRPLMQLIRLQAKRTPENLGVQNDLAMTAMLLDAQEIAPFDLAQKLYQQSPKNASFASTYAFSLYLQKKYSEALTVMQQLRPEELNVPSVAGYYGLILKATGDTTKAKSYLNWAINKGQLLPEERKMFEQALSN